MKNKAMAGVLGAILTLGVSATMADGLSLQSIGIDSAVQVTCNGTTLGDPYKLQPNTKISNISWTIVYFAFSEATTLNCTFNLDNKTHDRVGGATLLLSNGQGQATNLSPESGYQVTVTPGTDQFVDSMTVVLQKKPA
jgi:hypothetical protein